MRRLNQERGFTIVEMMFAVVILLVGALGTLAMLDTANKRSRGASDRQNGIAVGRQVIEAAKSIPYRHVAPGSIVNTLRQDQAIAGISASPWRIERDNTTYTIQASVCWLDEPADGLGSRAPGIHFCDGEGAGGTADGNSIDHKRVTVVVSWDTDAGAGSVRQSTLISARGGIDAPGVESVQLTSPASSPIIDPNATSASFAVTTNQDASAVVWSIDGAQQDAAGGSGRDWTFSWDLPPVDGTYDVSAQAFDSEGVGGEVRSATIAVNRFVPGALSDMQAARRAAGVVETTWLASPERDVVGYRVYRQEANGPAEVVCDLVAETTCVDSSPPPRTSAVLDYWVVAVDKDPQDQQREGAPSNRVDVNAPNEPPNAPIDLVLSKDVDGNSVLQWTPAAVGDPDGDPIDWYRIYRDGTAIGDRYAEVAGTQTTIVDYQTQGVQHQYWVTAVDSRFSESTFLGPVTG
jgi:prepilin-type N-terminal cleavage/methylation domain-containing protein